jgi:hypothetical protein
MSNNGGGSLFRLIRDIKTAIQHVRCSPAVASIDITEVDLEIKVGLQRSGGVEAKLDIISLGASSLRRSSNVQTIALKFDSTPATMETLSTTSEELADAIEIISKAVQEAADTPPIFVLNEAAVTLMFGVTDDGKIQVGITGSAEASTMNTIKLTLRRRDQTRQ